jgi:hypothetical protein
VHYLHLIGGYLLLIALASVGAHQGESVELIDLIEEAAPTGVRVPRPRSHSPAV